MTRSFGYKFPGYFMEYGPLQASSEQEARDLIRQRLGVRRLPWGLEIWDLAQRPLTRWKVAEAS